jgi:hypothetical protein
MFFKVIAIIGWVIIITLPFWSIDTYIGSCDELFTLRDAITASSTLFILGLYGFITGIIFSE